jgi:hypothetical protein
LGSEIGLGQGGPHEELIAVVVVRHDFGRQ